MKKISSNLIFRRMWRAAESKDAAQAILLDVELLM